ncbi:MAG: hypothetical protein HQM08_03135 [Candidatus Riflebacteria bacterium]|nr:hypothetical protein [Candidatus Riflebacteria bacterium]
MSPWFCTTLSRKTTELIILNDFLGMKKNNEGLNEVDGAVSSKKMEQILKHRNHIIEVLQAELEKTKNNRDSEANQKVIFLTEENQFLKSKIQELEEKKSVFSTIPQTEIDLLKNEILSLKEEIIRVEDRTKSEKEKLTSEIRNFTNRINELGDEKSKIEQELELEQKRKFEFQKFSSAKDLEINSLQDRIQKLSDELKELKEISLQQESKNSDLRSYQVEFKELVDRLQEIEIEEKKWSEEIKRLRNENDGILSSLETRTLELENSSSKIRELIEKNDQLENESSSLSSRVKNLEWEKNSLTAKNELIHGKNISLEKEIQQFKVEFAKRSRSIEFLENENQQLKLELEDTKLQKNRLSEELSEKLKQVSGIINERNRFLQERDFLVKKNNDFENEVKSLRDRNFSLHRIIFEGPRELKYSNDSMLKGAISPKFDYAKEESEDMMGLHLPFLFPERLPTLLKRQKKVFLDMRSVYLKANKLKPFIGPRPQNFLKNFLSRQMNDAPLLGNKLRKLFIKKPEFACIQGKSVWESQLPKNFPDRFGVVFFPSKMIISLFENSLPSPSKIRLTREKIVLRFKFLDFFLKHLISNLRGRVLRLFEKVDYKEKRLEKIEKSLIIKRKSTKEEFSSNKKFIEGTIETSKNLTFERKTFLLYLPKGRLGMLMKSMENSISSLNSRLDTAKNV